MFGRGLIYQFQMTIPVTVQGLGPCPLPQSVIDRSADAQREEKEKKVRHETMPICIHTTQNPLCAAVEEGKARHKV